MTGHDQVRFEELSERWLEGDEAKLEVLPALAATDPAMAMELRLMERSRVEGFALDASERAVLERVAKRISGREPARRSPLRLAMVAAAALAVLTGTAAAAYFAGARWHQQLPAQPQAAQPQPAASEPSLPPSVEPAAPPASSVEPTAPTDASVRTEPPAQGARTPSVQPPMTASAADLFARAARARREHHPRHAARLYRQLQARHAGSSEALASRLSLARLLLTRMHDARGALRQLDAYLRQAPRGSLAPECRYQRAVALRRLGQAEEEQQALRRSLREDPQSVYAAAARRRLDELNRGTTAK